MVKVSRMVNYFLLKLCLLKDISSVQLDYASLPIWLFFCLLFIGRIPLHSALCSCFGDGSSNTEKLLFNAEHCSVMNSPCCLQAGGKKKQAITTQRNKVTGAEYLYLEG